MSPDTNTMRKLIDQAAGDHVGLLKEDLRLLLNFVDLGYQAERKLAAIGGVITAPMVMA